MASLEVVPHLRQLPGDQCNAGGEFGLGKLRDLGKSTASFIATGILVSQLKYVASRPKLGQSIPPPGLMKQARVIKG
jgi:hypothetical protein